MVKHFLEQYKVQDKPEAKRAAERKELRTGEEGISQNRPERIQAYIERLEKIFLNSNQKVRKRNIGLLKPVIYGNTIIKAENFPESYFEYQKWQAKNLGMGEVEFNEEDKQKEITRVQEAQRKSLDVWIDHLSSDDSHYPADIKYFVMQGILRAGSFDKNNYRFSKRAADTTAPFYQIDHEALSMVMGALEAIHHQGDTTYYHQELLGLIKQNKDFGSMYAETMRYLDKESGKDKALEITDGEWRIFKQGSNPQELVNAFAGKRAYLCLGNIGDASGYLGNGDVHVYFSNNRAGEPVWPRVAIAVKSDAGAYEMRGTYNVNEDIDPEISKTDIIKNRLAAIPNGESFAKKDTDMRRLTEIYNKCFREDKKTKEKIYLNTTLTKEELQFLYEINSTIEGFGYQKDPRIAELRSVRNRNLEKDMLVIFECARDQIARTPEKINENTKVYVGLLEPGIFQKFPENLEYVYTQFPEERIKFRSIELGTGIKNGPAFQKAIEKQTMKVYSTSEFLVRSPDFKVVGERADVDLVEVSVRALGFTTATRYDQICQRAKELGLELCPVEVGPQLRLQYKDQPLDEHLMIAMNAIRDRYDFLLIFSVNHSRHSGLWLNVSYGWPDNKWDPGARFLFLRPSAKEKVGERQES